ncbi:hypothetical protein CGRA01v4_02836 [Colletotrichum graminicola]|nr:hypothetical protein CGRA01v4_02836 [Colletotrichum graminicola]
MLAFLPRRSSVHRPGFQKNRRAWVRGRRSVRMGRCTTAGQDKTLRESLSVVWSGQLASVDGVSGSFSPRTEKAPSQKWQYRCCFKGRRNK